MTIKAQIETTLERLAQGITLDALQRASEELRDILAIAHIIYHWVDTSGREFGCGTYSLAWQERYSSRKYQRIDPVVRACTQLFHPTDWKALDWSSKPVKAFLAEAIEYGLGRQGYTIPIRGPNGQFALFTANHECSDAEWLRLTETHRDMLILISHCFNKKALELEADRAPQPVAALSPRELDAMTLLAAGLSRAQIAQNLSISEHTLRVYIEGARFKLGAANTVHAVASALSRGLIVV